jgi:hypothetical protein
MKRRELRQTDGETLQVHLLELTRKSSCFSFRVHGFNKLLSVHFREVVMH